MSDPSPGSPPITLTEAQRQRLVDVIGDRAKSTCPRCGIGPWSIEGLVFFPVQGTDNPGAFVIGGPTIPAAAIACAHCGNMAFHALGVLGLLNDPTFMTPSQS